MRATKLWHQECKGRGWFQWFPFCELGKRWWLLKVLLFYCYIYISPPCLSLSSSPLSQVTLSALIVAAKTCACFLASSTGSYDRSYSDGACDYDYGRWRWWRWWWDDDGNNSSVPLKRRKWGRGETWGINDGRSRASKRLAVPTGSWEEVLLKTLLVLLYGNVFIFPFFSILYLTPSIQVSPAFPKFALCYFIFTKDLHEYLFSLIKRNLKKDFHFSKTRQKSENSVQRVVCNKPL